MSPQFTSRPSFRRLRKSLGWTNALRAFCTKREVVVRDREATHPLLCRPGTSDPDVFRDVFRRRAYACLGDVAEPGLAIDCGANVGYASAWLLTRYPKCRLIAIEPDAGNFAILQENLRPYGPRAVAVRAGVWPRAGGLRISEAPYRDGRAWAIQVRQCQASETADFPAIDLNTLLAESGFARISILKIDIEAAERELFAENLGWLKRVDHLAIELHDDDCEAAFCRAIAGLPFAVSRCGELTVCHS
jgi:FkbM family methyltransferase